MYTAYMVARIGSGTFPSIGVYLSLKSDAKVQTPGAIYLCGAILFVVLYYYFGVMDIINGFLEDKLSNS